MSSKGTYNDTSMHCENNN